MKLAFWRKDDQPDPEPKVIQIAQEHQMELREKWDRFQDSKKNRFALRYVFWSSASALYPEIKDGVWKILWGGVDGHFVKVAEDE